MNQMVTLMIAIMVSATLLNWTVSTTEASPTTSMQSELKDLINKRKSLNLIRVIVDELDSSLFTLNKLGCQMNLPGYNCANLGENEYLMYGQELTGRGGGGGGGGGDFNIGYWLPHNQPTDQKRAPCLNFDGTACVSAQTAEEMKNRKGWKVGPGRRKRSSN